MATCRCVCGNTKTTRMSRILNGSARSCGCLRVLDMVGKRFDRLVVESAAGVDRHGHAMWNCICDCGKRTKNIVGISLSSGNTQSCGCIRRESWHARKRNPDHPKEYNAWKAMHQRCNNPNNPSYRDYGARGIRVSKRWSGPKGFAHFLADVGLAPSPSHSLDRINPNKNYTASNVRWASVIVQARNRRGVRKETLTLPYPERSLLKKAYNSWAGMKQRCLNKNHHAYKTYGGRGVTVCHRWQVSFSAFIEDVGLPPSFNHSLDRIDAHGHYEPGNVRWATARQQAENRRGSVLLKNASGRMQALSAWARETGLSASTIRYWNLRGKSLEEILIMEHRA